MSTPLSGAKGRQNRPFDRAWEHTVNLQTLEHFIIAAREHTIRGQSRRVPPERPGAVEVVYREGGLTYRDSYFGQSHLLGQEIVRRAGSVVWGMHYWIYVLDLPLPGDEVAAFLQRAQQARYRDRRLLGPFDYQERSLRYQDQNEGKLDQFRGEVLIYHQDQIIFRMRYEGGTIR
jgi:hypothetical protein